MPPQWYDCGDFPNSPPDLQPGKYSVLLKAYEGKTYLGMVVREDGSKEAIGQRLFVPLLPNQCYSLSFYVARSPIYESVNEKGIPTSFTDPVQLYIWAGNSNCEKTVLLGMTEAIENTEWQKVTFDFQVPVPCQDIFLEANFVEDDWAYPGNVLVDDISPIQVVDCVTGLPLAKAGNFFFPIHRMSDEALRNWIFVEAQNIRLDPTDTQLEEAIFATPEGELVKVNQPLWKIARMLKKYPDVQLHVLIPATSKYYKRTIQYQIHQVFQAAGYSGHGTLIDMGKKGSKKTDWFWEPGEQDIRIGLRWYD
ncbi:MAG TPA: hypothetical protein PKA00_13760 [Saprospiraceae bacterium]|nr:hypothetical protein [Saprospiraceae bacterium]HMQ83977.1 hypothetical protein [Saprospiraceae bacterium]